MIHMLTACLLGYYLQTLLCFHRLSSYGDSRAVCQQLVSNYEVHRKLQKRTRSGKKHSDPSAPKLRLT
jgi:hypothetical protein